MRLREFDEKERLEKANEKLEKYKTAAGSDAATADAAGNFARGHTRFKGINRATKKQFANDTKLSQLKELEINESIDPKRDKAERMIWKYYGQIYDYGDDDGLNYLDEQGELWNQLMDKYNGEIDDIVAQEPIEVLMQAAQELKGIAGDMKYELDEADLADPSRRGFLKKAAGAAAAGAAMSAAGPEIVTLVKGFAEQAGGMNGIQALKAMLKVATADELYNMYDYYSDSGILEDAITDSDMRALQRVKGFRDYEDWSDFEEYCEDNNDVNPVEEFERLTGRPLKVSLVDDIVGKIDDTWSLENFFDEYPDALKIINPFENGSISMPTLQQLGYIDTAAKGAHLPAPIVAMANAVSGLVRQIFKSNGQSLAAPQQTTAHPARHTPALPAPTRPEFDMTPDLKQKEKVPVQRKGDDEEQYYRPAPEHIQQALDSGQLGDKNFFQSIVDGTDKNPWVTPEKAQEILNKYYGPQDMAEAAQGHTIEAHGVRGMDRRTWHKTFKNTDQMMAWAEKHDAEIVGTRDLEQARHHNLSPAKQGAAEGLTEMDKSQTPPGRDGNQQSPRDDRQSRGRDTGPRSGPDRVAKPVSKQKATRDMGDMFNQAFTDSHKKKDVSEATDSATSNLIWKAMNYLPHNRPKDMEDILVQIAHNQGPVTRVTDDPEKLASLVQAVWMDGQTRKQKAGQQLDELSKDTLKDYMRAQPARIKGPAGLATTNPKKAARIVDPEKGDMRRALTKLKDPAYGQQGVAEDSIAAMRRLAGIVTPIPAVVSNGPRQYRHMPTAVQPR
jgi:hypothetical protein